MIQLNNCRQTLAKIGCGLLFTLPWLNSLNASQMANFDITARTSLTSTTTTRCPENFSHSGILNVCVADSLTIEVVRELMTNGLCHRGYEKIPGTQFCIEKNHYMTANRHSYLIAGRFSEYCPENFSRPPGSDVCLEKQLSLIEFESELMLIASTGGTGVPPDETVGLFAPPPPECESGFIRPPGFHFCIANTLAANAEPEQYEFDIPTGRCPAQWARKKSNGFCLPIYNLHICGKEIPCQAFAGDSFVVSARPLNCPDGYLKKQTNVPSYDNFNPDSFTMTPVYACVPPDKSLDPS